MPSTANRKLIRVFVSFPSDVKMELDCLKRVIAELNAPDGVADQQGCVIQIVEWRDLVPEIGGHERVIFEQLSIDSLDIFIGALWTRFGTVTPEKNSRERHEVEGDYDDLGTEKDFTFAYNSWKQTKRPRILMYRNISDLPWHNLNLPLVQKVLDLCSMFESDGAHPGFLQTYRGPEDFEIRVRKDLIRLLPTITVGRSQRDDKFSTSIETLPALPKTFIGRGDEIAAFTEAVTTIGRNPRGYGRRVFLFRGEGGMGKSTLFGRLLQECQNNDDSIFWVYIDWEAVGVEQSEGTPKMMSHIVGLFNKRYSIDFPEFRSIEEKRRQTGEKISILRDEFNSISQVEFFEKLLSERLTEFELDLRHNAQRVLSEAFLRDLFRIVRIRPLVFLFDTFEAVKDFSDLWIREGLIRYCLGQVEIENRFVFAIAGRVTDKEESIYRDDIDRRFSFEGALYRKSLDKFTPGEIQEYLTKVLNKAISWNVSEKLWRLSYGIPLAVNIIGAMLSEKGFSLLDQELLKEERLIEENVIPTLTLRFLKYCLVGDEVKELKELECVYSFVLLREPDSSEANNRLELLAILWAKIKIIASRDEFHEKLNSLERKYSFLFSGNRMHPDVRSCLRRFTMRGVDLPLDINKFCEIAVEICVMKCKKRLIDLEKQYGKDEVERIRYRDALWQQWNLDQLNYQMWLGRHDVVMELLINHYVMAVQYGTDNYHLRVIGLIKEDQIFFDSLSERHRALVHRLSSLKEWLASQAMEIEREELLGALKGDAKIEGKVLLANASINRKMYERAYSELIDAERMYLELQQASPALEEKLSSAYLSLGMRWSQSSRRKAIQNKSLEALRKALRYKADRARLRLAMAEVLINLGRPEEARIEYYNAYRLGAQKEANVGLDNVSALLNRGRYSRTKQARILTARANSLSSSGEFDAAEQLYIAAIRSAVNYVVPYLKLAHLYKNLGQLHKAAKAIRDIPEQNYTNEELAMIHNAQGAIYYANQRWEDARKEYSTAIDLTDNYINPHAGLGRVYLRIAQLELAMDALNRAWEIKKRSDRKIQAYLFWVHNNLGLVHMASRQYNGASLHFKIAEMLCLEHIASPSESRQYLTISQLGIARLGQKKYKEAEEAFKQFKTFPTARGVILELLWEVELLGEHDQSEDWRRICAFMASLL